MTLRPYQQDARAAVHESLKHFRVVLVEMPTGSGKTVLFSVLTQDWIADGGRVLIGAHRDELINQSIDKLHRATGLNADKEKADFHASRNSRAVVGSIQSLQGNRLEQWPRDHFTHIIIDEGHHLLAQSYRNILDHFNTAKVVVVTATPDRGDKRDLMEIVDHVAYRVPMNYLIDEGYLAPICWNPQGVKIDLSAPLPPDRNGNDRSGGVRLTGGDFNPEDVADAIDPYLEAVSGVLVEEAAFRRTLVFLPLRATSEKFAAICNRRGLRAEHIDGESTDRKDILDRYARGEIDVLCNAMLLTEGFDDPGIDCILNLRLTKSRSLFCQIVGRGSRLLPGCAEHETREERLAAIAASAKQNLLLLDFLFLLEKHNLICPADLIAETREQADTMKRIAFEKAAGGANQEEMDLREISTAAVSEIQIKREARLAEELKALEKKKARVMDAMEACALLHRADLVDYEPVTRWQAAPVTPGQAQILKNFGIDWDTVSCAGHASELTNLLIERARKGLVLPKKMRLCRKAGWKSISADTTDEKADRYLAARGIHFGNKRNKQMEMAA